MLLKERVSLHHDRRHFNRVPEYVTEHELVSARLSTTPSGLPLTRSGDVERVDQAFVNAIIASPPQGHLPALLDLMIGPGYEYPAISSEPFWLTPLLSEKRKLETLISIRRYVPRAVRSTRHIDGGESCAVI